MTLIEVILNGVDNVEQLRTGGQRSAYAASHSEYGDVVIKYCRYKSDTSLERMIREANYLSAARIPGIPLLFDFISDSTKRECVSIEQRIPGQELSECKSRFRSEEDILRLLRRVVTTMSHVWRDGVVHRDLKPSNIIIAENDEPYVVDFGIARFLNEADLTKTIFSSGPATHLYAAPEQLTNDRRRIDHRTDCFALGIVGLELMLQQHPFSSHLVGGGSIPENIVQGKVYTPVTTDCSEGFARVMLTLVGHQQYQRYRTATDVLNAIDSVLGEVK